MVWYNLNGAGSQPSIPGAILIAITYSSSDSLQSIELKTISAINRVYFKVPDMRGMYIKGWANGSSVDKNVGLRYSANSTRFEHPQLNLPAYIGSQQKDVILAHSHARAVADFGTVYENTWTSSFSYSSFHSQDADKYLLNNGTSQNDVKNIYLNYVIKY